MRVCRKGCRCRISAAGSLAYTEDSFLRISSHSVCRSAQRRAGSGGVGLAEATADDEGGDEGEVLEEEEVERRGVGGGTGASTYDRNL